MQFLNPGTMRGADSAVLNYEMSIHIGVWVWKELWIASLHEFLFNTCICSYSNT